MSSHQYIESDNIDFLFIIWKGIQKFLIMESTFAKYKKNLFTNTVDVNN